MKALRTIAFLVAALVPATVFAAVAPDCCGGPCCAAGCPFCHHAK
ncbi:MAG TPA: hypothetical protein VGM39_06310 [Kofleriaceae bacterium]